MQLTLFMLYMMDFTVTDSLKLEKDMNQILTASKTSNFKNTYNHFCVLVMEGDCLKYIYMFIYK